MILDPEGRRLQRRVLRQGVLREKHRAFVGRQFGMADETVVSKVDDFDRQFVDLISLNIGDCRLRPSQIRQRIVERGLIVPGASGTMYLLEAVPLTVVEQTRTGLRRRSHNAEGAAAVRLPIGLCAGCGQRVQSVDWSPSALLDTWNPPMKYSPSWSRAMPPVG